MAITVLSRKVADVRVDNIALRPTLGGYELLCTISGTTLQPITSAGQTPYWFTIFGALINVGSTSGLKRLLTIARPDRPFRMQQEKERQLRIGFELKAILSPHQVAAIEDFCHEQELRFELVVSGEGGVPTQTEKRDSIFDTWSITVPRSRWTEQLRSAGALDILLIEVPMPVGDVPPEWRASAEHLKRAQRMFVEGNYSECVSRCRAVLDLVANHPITKQKWTEALKMLDKERELMSKEQREIAILAAVRNYTHLAHHPDDAPGSDQFLRSEAKLLLTLTASAIAYLWNAGGSSVR